MALEGPMSGAAVTLNGRHQTLSVALPSVLIQDPACAASAWRLSFALSAFAQGAPKRPALLPRSLQITWPGAAHPVAAALATTAGQAEATLVIPRLAGQNSTVLAPSVELDVPANAYAGQYTVTAAVTIAEGP